MTRDPALPRLLPAGPPAGLAAHLARHGPPPPASARRDGLLAEVGRAGLTGRGGAAFPAARKLAAVARAGGQPVVIVNGTEGEPASAKDKVLMTQQPHLVLDGAAVAAAIVAATEVIVVAHHAVRETIERAAAERAAVGLDDTRVAVVTAADGFVSGEARAVVHWVASRVPAPTITPPRLAQRGLHGRPTLVHNAETLAHLALIARYGARWFCERGTPAEPGSLLVTVTGAVSRPGVVEIEPGVPVADVLARAGGPDRPLRALLVGGYFGTWVPWPAAADLPFSAAGLATAGATPGAGLVAALPADRCGLAETAWLACYLAAESAGQCGPCVFGLAAIAGELAALADGAPADRGSLRRWLAQVEGRGACAHPDGAARLVRSALSVFAAEADLHDSGWCSGADSAAMLPAPAQDRT
jgi:NADH:ubiquinone oxidoreductase subunit F (NADH-binding)